MRRVLRFALPAIALVALAGSPLAVFANPPDDLAEKPHSQNMHLIGTSLRAGAVSGPLPNGPGDVPWDTRNTDLAFWGNTVIQGRYDGFRVIDAKAPGNPKELAKFTCISPQGDIGVWGNLVFRAVDSVQQTDGCTTDRTQNGNPTTAEACAPAAFPCIGFEGIQIFDISNLSNIRLIKSVALDCGSHTFTPVPDIENNRVLLYNSPSGASTQSGTTKYGNRCTAPFRREDIVSVPFNNPTAASVIGSFSLGVSPTGTFVNTCHDFGAIQGDVNLGACAGSPLASIFDISNPAAPVFKFTVTSPTVTGYHSGVFSFDGETVAMGWEPGGGTAPRCMATGTPLNQSMTQFQTDEMKTIFFHSTVDGSLVGRHVLPRPQSQYENCTIHNYNVVPHPTRDILVHGSYQSGIGVVDFTDLSNAYEFAWMDPAPLDPPSADPAGVGGRTNFRGGDWSSFWYNGYIYESDTRRGLYIYKVSGKEMARANQIKLDFLNPQTMHISR